MPEEGSLGNLDTTPDHSCLVFVTRSGVKTSGARHPKKISRYFSYPLFWSCFCRHLEVSESRETL